MYTYGTQNPVNTEKLTNGSSMKVERIVECSFLQYIRPALSNNWSWKPIFGISESGRFT